MPGVSASGSDQRTPSAEALTERNHPRRPAEALTERNHPRRPLRCVAVNIFQRRPGSEAPQSSQTVEESRRRRSTTFVPCSTTSRAGFSHVRPSRLVANAVPAKMPAMYHILKRRSAGSYQTPSLKTAANGALAAFSHGRSGMTTGFPG